MAIVDVATDRPHLGRRHVYVHDSRAYTAGDKVVLHNGNGTSGRVVAAVLSAAADCLLGFTEATGAASAPYEMRAGVPLVLPYTPEGYHSVGPLSHRLWCDTTTTVNANVVFATDSTAASVDFSTEVDAQHLGAPLHYIADTASYPTTPTTTELLAAVSGRRLRVLQVYAQTNGGTGTLSSFYSSTTKIAEFHSGDVQPGVILPFNPLGWFVTNAGEDLRYAGGGVTGRLAMLVQEAA